MLVGSEGKSRLRTAMQFELSQYFKIIQDWSTVIWRWTMGMTSLLNMDVELHYVVKCGILAVAVIIHDR